MNVGGVNIDEIVAGVLKQLGSAAPAPAPKNTNCVSLDESVVTEELLAEKAGGAASIRLGSSAVITPSGRDWLRKNNITWERCSAQTAGSSATWNLFAVACSPAVEKIADDLIRNGWGFQLAADSGEAVTGSVSGLCRGEFSGAAILTDEPERAACRANRNDRIRAAAVTSVADVKRIKTQLGANLFAVAPGERSFFELRNLLRAIAAGGPPAEPENW